MAWKSAPDGDAAQRSFHAGSCKSSNDFGSWSTGSVPLLYANTVERAAMPVHLPLDGRYWLGTWSRTSGFTSEKSPAFSTSVIAGEFSVRNTSAGDLSPS